MMLNSCPNCKKETLPLATYSRGYGHAEHYHYCDDCKKTHVATMVDTLNESQ